MLRRGRRGGAVPGADADGLLARRPRPPGCGARRRRAVAGHGGRGLRRPPAADRLRCAAAPPQPRLQLRGRRPPRPRPRRGPEVLSAHLPRVLRGAAARFGRRRAWRYPRRWRRRAVRHRPAVRRRRRPRPGRPRRGLRGHVDPRPAERRGGARGRDAVAQPVGQPDHGRAGRGSQAAVPVGVVALPGRLRVLSRRPGRVIDRPGVGRSDDDLRERCAARRDGALRGRRPAGGRRRRSRPAAAGAAAHGDIRRQPARTRRADRRVPPRRVHPRPAGYRPRAPAQRRALPVRPRRRRPAQPRLLRGLQHPGLRLAAAAAGDRRPEGRHRRLRRARLDPGAARRRPGDGSCGAPAQRHPRLHASRLRHQRGHQDQRAPAHGRARRHRRGDRHPAHRQADARGDRAIRSRRARRSTT